MMFFKGNDKNREKSMMFAASRFSMTQFAKTVQKYYRLRTPGGAPCFPVLS